VYLNFIIYIPEDGNMFGWNMQFTVNKKLFSPYLKAFVSTITVNIPSMQGPRILQNRTIFQVPSGNSANFWRNCV
jgi:hypothetical protein